ncbi:MAG: hypothetical protein U0U66_09815 [Cytophagaceae bacterium]
MKSVWLGFLCFLVVACATKKSQSVTDFHVGVFQEPVDSLKKTDAHIFQDTILWIATAKDGSQFSMSKNNSIYYSLYNHQKGKYQNGVYDNVQSIIYPDSLWLIQPPVDTSKIEISIRCGSKSSCVVWIDNRVMRDLELDILVPSYYHDIFVLQKYNHIYMRDWKTLSHQVMLEVNTTEDFMMIHGKCGSYQVPFQYKGLGNFCMGKSNPVVTPCNLVYSEVELVASIQQRGIKVTRECNLLKIIAEKDTLTFLKVD